MQLFTVVYALFHTILCKKFVTVIGTFKLIFQYKVFSTKLYAHKMFGLQEFGTIFQGHAKKYLETPDLFHQVVGSIGWRQLLCIFSQC